MTAHSISVFKDVDLDLQDAAPLYQQIYWVIQEKITDGNLSPGTRLPSTRDLASELDVSRNTVEKAFEMLRSEGYLHRQVGAGTYVSRALPERHTQVKDPSELPPFLRLADPADRDPTLSSKGDWIMDASLSMLNDPVSQMAFRPGVPALDAFPLETWAKLASRRWHSVPKRELVYGNPAGYPPLRDAVAEYLRTTRGVRCETEQVLIVSGSQMAFSLAAHLLVDAGDPVYFEDPGYPQMRATFTGVGAQVHSVPVDDQGMDPSAFPPAPLPRLIGVTPSHQYPLGMTMSLPRRVELLEWAAENEVWILEDDYDSEFRYSGRPIVALQGFDNVDRVLYAGTFSKVLFPALRLGYLVLPPNLVEPFLKMRALSDRSPPRVQQMILTDFITEGHFEQHIRQMRTLYAERQNALLKALDTHLGDFIDVEGRRAGLHLIGWLPEEVDDQTVSDHLDDHGIVALPLSNYSDRPLARGGLLLGYGGIPKEEMHESVRQMANALSPFLS